MSATRSTVRPVTTMTTAPLHPRGAAGGENLVLTHSGWGDGFYPVITTHDAEGRLLGVHLDLLVADATHWKDATDEENE